MAKINSVKMLADLAQEAVQKAFEQVGQAKSMHQHSMEQLDKLQEYRHDYLQRLQASMITGIRSSVAINASGFIDNIDRAILKQQDQVHELERLLVARQQNWMGERRKFESLSTLVSRGNAAQAIIANRQEQKSNDEFAARSYARMKFA